MREIKASVIKDTIESLVKQAAFELPGDVLKKIQIAGMQEASPEGKEILQQILANAEIARSECLPLCQDCGLTIVFMDIGQEVCISGNDLIPVINDGVRKAYRENYLRKSVVSSPVNRTNTGENTPAIVHCNLVPGDQVRITVMLKGGGCENMSYMKMLTPAEGVKGIKKFVIESVYNSGANPCPPIIIGVGIGGDFEYAALLAKKSLLRELGTANPEKHLDQMEKEFLTATNQLGIGPQGFGGKITALAVHILEAPCHIASLPVAVNIECHSHRHKEAII